MPSLFKPTYTDKKTGKPRKAKKWYGQFKDQEGTLRRVPLSANKSAAQTMLAELVKQAEMGKAGIRDPFAPHRKTLMTRHRDDWLAVLTARGRDKAYTDLKKARVSAILAGCGFVYPADLSPEKLERFLEALRKGEARGQPAPAGKTAPKPKKLSVQTTNDYLQAVSQLCVWMVENQRIERNPFDSVKKGNPERDRRHVRRVMDATELQRLIETTQNGAVKFRGLTGHDRAVLYAVAAATGYRKSELAALSPQCFHLTGDNPTIELSGEFTKNGKSASQPLSATLAAVLAQYIAGKSVDQPVWAGTWSEKGSRMLKADAQAAEIATEVTTKDGPQVLDFHSLRGTFATFLDTINVSLKARQDLMRHSDPRLTMNRYTRANQSEMGDAATRMPVSVPDRKVQSDSACIELAQPTAGDSGHKGATAENKGAGVSVAEPAPKPVNQGFCKESQPIEVTNERATCEIRTHDPRFTKAVHYHCAKVANSPAFPALFSLRPPTGFRHCTGRTLEGRESPGCDHRPGRASNHRSLRNGSHAQERFYSRKVHWQAEQTVPVVPALPSRHESLGEEDSHESVLLRPVV